MADPGETKILRDEVARVVAENKEFRNMVSAVLDAMKRKDRIIDEQRLEIEILKRNATYHDNPHSPPSHNSFTARKRKSEARIPKEQHKRPGGKKGHAGESHHRKSVATETRKPDRCGCCDGENLAYLNERIKQVLEIERIPQAQTTTYVMHDAMCLDCRRYTVAKEPGTKGTAFGNNLLTFVSGQWYAKCSISTIRERLEMFGVRVSIAMVQNAISTTAERLEPIAEEMSSELANANNLAGDETPYEIGGSSGFVWTCISENVVKICAKTTRSSVVIEQEFPHYEKPITVDGYPGYNDFKTRQRCWAHILRESKKAAEEGPHQALLHKKLQKLYHDAKLAPPDQKLCDRMVIRAKSIAQMYMDAGHKFGTKLDNAAPYLFTFVMHVGMQPTNNEAERMLRSVVIHRKIRQRISSVDGMKTFGVLMTCYLTWRKRGLNVTDQLLKALGAT